MRGVVSDELPDELGASIEELVEARERLGVSHDECWEGVWYLAAASRGAHGVAQAAMARLLAEAAERLGGYVAVAEFNLGDGRHDHRVPDAGLLPADEDRMWYPSAPLVVEVLSPGDRTFDKLGFYAPRVGEVVVVDPAGRTVRCFVRAGRGRDVRLEETAGRSPLLGMNGTEVAAWLAENRGWAT